jgi:hypothetical protein
MPDENKCPCKKTLKCIMLTCKSCKLWWHQKCVGLTGLRKEDLEKLSEWLCPHCYVIPEGAQKEITLITIDKKLTDMKADLLEKIEKKSNDQTKKWSDLFKEERDSDQEEVVQVVTQAVEKSKMRMDYDHMEREKRKKNFVLREIEESSANTPEDKREEDKIKIVEIVGLDIGDIEYVQRVGKPSEDARPRPLIITVKTPEMAAALHGHGRGRKFSDANSVDVWCNPDRIAADRKADFLARQERNKRRLERENNRATGGRTRAGSFLPSSQSG